MFEYEGLRLRPIESSDLDYVYMIRTDPSTAEMLGTLILTSFEDQLLWLNLLKKDKTKAYYILETGFSDGEYLPIGYLRFDEIDLINRSMRVGGDIALCYRNKGYGKKMMGLIEKFCFDYLNMHRLWLLVLSTNKVAKHVYEKSGFEKEGVMRKAVYKNGEYLDYEMYSILKEDYF
jgi:diamine N-acetyltransferase